MKRMVMLVVILAVTGCAGGFGKAVNGLPSVQNCERVSYLRENNKVTIAADCRLPAADPGGLGIAKLL